MHGLTALLGPGILVLTGLVQRVYTDVITLYAYTQNNRPNSLNASFRGPGIHGHLTRIPYVELLSLRGRC